MRHRLSSRKRKTGLVPMVLLAAGLAALPSCATAPKKTIQTAKPEPDPIAFPIMIRRKRCSGESCSKTAAPLSQKDRTIARVAKEAGLNSQDIKKLAKTRTTVHVVRVGDTVALWPGEESIKVTKIDSKEARFSDGTRLECGGTYLYIDINLLVLVSNMNSKDRSVIIVVARDDSCRKGEK